MEYLAFFPTMVFHEDLLNFEVINSKLLTSIDILKQTDLGVQKSNTKGWHSDDRILLYHPDFSNLLEYTKLASKEVLKNLKWDLNLKIDNCWITISPTGASNSIHTHPGAILSGVYYIQAPEGSSPLLIHDPRQAKVHTNPQVPHTALTTDIISLTPKEGRLYMFPGWLQHSVPENKSLDSRIVFSFNLVTT